MIADAGAVAVRPVRRLAIGVATVAIVVGVLLVALVGSAAHVWNMHGASIVCETGSPIRGGWAEPDMCSTGAGDDHPASHDPLHPFDPWTSALVAATVIGGFVLVSVRAIAALNDTTLRLAAARFVVLSVLLAAAGAVAYGTLLVPS